MAVITFPRDRVIEVPEGTTILHAAREAGIVIESPCSSAGTCGKCVVRIHPSSLPNVVSRGRHRAAPEQEALGFVLSCGTEIVGDVTVQDLPQRQTALQVLRHGTGGSVQLDPFVAKELDPEKNLTRVVAGGEELALEEGDTRSALYGVVIDIGTTTLAASLVDLSTGSELACNGGLNPQSIHAQDVLSRIHFASAPQGIQTMQEVLMDELRQMVAALAREAAVEPGSVYEIVFSGNTCMLHLALGVDPASLGKFPYTPVLRGGESLPAPTRLSLAPRARLYLPPVISGYVGADITSGMLATRLHSEPGMTLLVDIGTNGEMVLAAHGKLFATSTAAGPAFEGMNISCGMRAGKGAIERFRIGPDGALMAKTIGDAEAVGICGSGLMDIVAELVSCGVVLESGRFSRGGHALAESLRRRLVTRGGKTFFHITEKVELSQKDIRQVQLAKGAVRAGIELILQRVGIEAEQVDRVLVAGSFGYHLRAESLLTIGLLPGQFAGKIEFVGNTSQSGGKAFLLNRSAREEMAAVVGEVEVVELANSPDFDSCFIRCMGFAGARKI